MYWRNLYGVIFYNCGYVEGTTRFVITRVRRTFGLDIVQHVENLPVRYEDSSRDTVSIIKRGCLRNI